MSTKTDNDSQSQQNQDPDKKPNSDLENQAPKEGAENQVAAAGSEKTQGQIIADAIDAILKANPNLTPDQAGALVLSAMKKVDTVEEKVAKEVSMIIPNLNRPDTVFLKKDKKKKFPIERAALSGIIVRQTRTRVVEGEEVEIPARDLNEIGIYTEEDFAKFSEKGNLFELNHLNIEVWHKPGDTDTIAE